VNDTILLIGGGMSKFLWFLFCFLGLVGCSREVTDSDAEDAVATGIGALSSSILAQSSHTISKREITTCGTLVFADECSSETKTATYTDCAIGSTDLKYSGHVALRFKGPLCRFTLSDDAFTRIVELTRDGLLGSTVTTSSELHKDYRGNTIGGGSTTTKTPDGSNTEIMGLHKIRTNKAGEKTFDISFRTTDSFVANHLARGTFAIQSGTMEVIHNLAEYTATFVAKDLVLDPSACCYPTSGTVSVTYAGSITGAASVSFGTCGEVTFTRNGAEKSLTLAGCE